MELMIGDDMRVAIALADHGVTRRFGGALVAIGTEADAIKSAAGYHRAADSAGERAGAGGVG